MKDSASTPIDIIYQNIKEIIPVINNKYRILLNDFAYVSSFARLINIVNLLKNTVYRLKEGRIIHITQGSVQLRINLTSYTLQAGDLFLTPPGAVCEMLSFTPDFDSRLILVCDGFLKPVDGTTLFESHLLHEAAIYLPAHDEIHVLCRHFYPLLEHVITQKPFRRDVTQHLVMAFLYNIRHLAEEQLQQNDNGLQREKEIFRRFIALANRHCLQERTVTFYAGKLCLTPRYLNTVIRKVSSHTVMYWVNEAIILECKLALQKYSVSVNELSDRMHFSNPSFFCKFFKKHTGLTPLQYRHGD